MLFNRIRQWFGSYFTKNKVIEAVKPISKAVVDYHSRSTYSVIAYAIYDLPSLSEQEQKILVILKENVHLAAICEAQAFQTNQNLYKKIIKQAQQDIDNKQTVNATLALLVYKEFRLLAKLLNLEAKHKFRFKKVKESYEYIYNILIHTAGSFDDAQRFFSELETKFPLQKQNSSSCMSYKISYSTLINKAPYEEAIDLFKQMQQKGLKIDEIYYNTLINKAPYYKAIELFKEMKIKKLKPDVVTFYSLLKNTKILKNEIRIKKIIALFNEMIATSIKPDNRIYKVVKPILKIYKNDDNYRAWIEDARIKLEKQPKLQGAWEKIFKLSI